MESVVVAKIKPGQSVTLTFGEKEVILTKINEPAHFKIEDWFTEEEEIYLLDPVIAEERLLHFSRYPADNPAGEIEANRKRFGAHRTVCNFQARPVESIESEDLEEEEEEEEGEGEKEE